MTEPTPGPIDRDHALALLLAGRGMLLGYIGSITGDPDLAEDVFQEASLVIVAKCGRLSDAAGFAPWARTIARFEALKAMASRRREVRLSPEILDLLEPAWNADDAPGAERPLIALRACLDRLAPRARQVVDLRYFRGLDGSGVAEATGLPLNTVYVTLARVHRALGDCVRRRLVGVGS